MTAQPVDRPDPLDGPSVGICLRAGPRHHHTGRDVWMRHAALGTLLVTLACGDRPGTRVLDLPPGTADLPGAEAIAHDIRDLPLAAREERIYEEIARGNVPRWLRRLQPVEMEGEAGGETHRITFWVTPDYLTIGSDDDYMIMPLSASTAQRVADLADAALPTPAMVDAIWLAADAHFEPVRFTPDEFMASVQYFERHNNLINAQRMLYDAPPGAFIAGHKVDVVMTAGLSTHPGAIALYGWHRRNGEPIQHLYVGATDSLVAFSHGIRLVDRTVLVDRVERDLFDVWQDPDLAPILSTGGVITPGRYDSMESDR